MEQAIRKAIEGGWHPKYAKSVVTRDQFNVKCRILLDPLFWQSLGKALGWDKIHYEKCPAICYADFRDPGECNCSAKDEWKSQWHSFIDYLAEGKDAESFFTRLVA